MRYKSNILHVTFNSKVSFKLRSLIHYWIYLFMEGNKMFVSFLYQKANMSACLHSAVKLQVTNIRKIRNYKFN